MSKPTGFPNVSHRTAQAMLNVLDAINAREGSNFPSKDVQRKALRILDRSPKDHGITDRGRALVIDVRGEADETYAVELFVQARARTMSEIEAGDIAGPYEHIIDVRCSCPATTTCSHLLVALTSAERDGLRLAV